MREQLQRNWRNSGHLAEVIVMENPAEEYFYSFLLVEIEFEDCTGNEELTVTSVSLYTFLKTLILSVLAPLPSFYFRM